MRLFRLAASLALLALALTILDWQAILDAVVGLDLLPFLLVVALCLAVFCVMAWRWVYIIGPEIPRPALAHVSNYLVSTFFNIFAPGALGGDLYRFATGKDEAGGRMTVALAILRERTLGVVSLLLLFLVLLPLPVAGRSGWSAELEPILVATALLAVVATAGLLIGGPLAGHLSSRVWALRWPALGKALELVRRILVFRGPGDFAWLMALSSVKNLFWIGAVWAVAADLGTGVSLAEVGMIAVMVELVRFLPLTIQGVGVREGLFGYFFAAMGYGGEAGFAVGAIAYIALNLAMLLSGILGRAMARRDDGGDEA